MGARELEMQGDRDWASQIRVLLRQPGARATVERLDGGAGLVRGSDPPVLEGMAADG